MKFDLETINQKKLVKIEGLDFNILTSLLNEDSWMVGGCVRDTLSGKKNINDVDIYTRTDFSVFEDNFKKLSQNDKSLSQFVTEYHDTGRYAYFLVNNVKIETRFIENMSVEYLIKHGDIAANGVAYNFHKNLYLNKEFVDDAINHRLRFIDEQNAETDPTIIFSALKYISRNPEVVIDKKTVSLIHKNINAVSSLVDKNTIFREKFSELIFNQNYIDVREFFPEDWIKKIEKSAVFKGNIKSTKYESRKVSDLEESEVTELENYILEKYGRRGIFIKNAVKNFSGVVFSRDKDKKISATCVFDKYRLYSIAGDNINDIYLLVKDIVESNYSIWTTITSKYASLINKSKKAGLVAVSNHESIKKILASQYPHYRNCEIIFGKENENVTFLRKDSNNFPQVLLTS